MISVVFMEIIFTVIAIYNDFYIIKFLKKIKKYLLEENINQQGCFYWNEHGLLLSDDYIFIDDDNGLVACRYDIIKSIKTEEFYTKSSKDYHKKHIYIHITMNNENKVSAQVYDENWGSLDAKEDIVPLLIKKNPNIIVEESDITPWYKHKDTKNNL